MNLLLLDRSSGSLGPNRFARLQAAALLRSFAPAPRFRFDGGEPVTTASTGLETQGGGSAVSASQSALRRDPSRPSIRAHPAGVSALALERFDGRLMISGSSDATIKLWDLEQCPNPSHPHTYRPVQAVARAGSDSSGHRFGITHLSFYPFDSAAFLSCSHDQTLKLWSTERAAVSGSFGLGARVYTHATSPIASHLLVACGTQHPAVRLVDLRSASAVQSLVSPGQLGGSAGATLAVAWSPVHEHVLAAGSVDGAIRIWDVRKSNGLVDLLDQEDVVGLADEAEITVQHVHRQPRPSAKAHAGPVNGLAWTDDGAYLVSAGHDRRIRVWDAATGANTLANFGPSIRNSQMGTVGMFVSPTGLTHPGGELLFFPNETEILGMDLHEGSIITRLRAPGPPVAAPPGTLRGGERATGTRVTNLVWRGAGGSGGSSGVVMGGSNAPGGIYSGHADGQILAWFPRLEGADDEAGDKFTQDVSGSRAKKRKVLDDAFRSLMGKQITFSGAPSSNTSPAPR